MEMTSISAGGLYKIDLKATDLDSGAMTKWMVSDPLSQSFKMSFQYVSVSWSNSRAPLRWR